MKQELNAHRMRAQGPGQSRAPAEVAILKSTPKSAGARAVSDIDLGRIYSRYAGDLVKFARRWGFSPEDAEDYAQEFFLRLAEKDCLEKFDHSKGKLHSFLLTLFQRFLANQWHSRHALRRGGASVTLPLRGPEKEVDALIDWKTPSKLAELRWARLLVERALQTLRNDLVRQGKGSLFDALLPHLLHKFNGSSYAHSARQVGLSGAALRMIGSRYRERLRVLICRELEDTSPGDGQAHEDVRYLLAIFGE